MPDRTVRHLSDYRSNVVDLPGRAERTRAVHGPEPGPGPGRGSGSPRRCRRCGLPASLAALSAEGLCPSCAAGGARRAA